MEIDAFNQGLFLAPSVEATADHRRCLRSVLVVLGPQRFSLSSAVGRPGTVLTLENGCVRHTRGAAVPFHLIGSPIIIPYKEITRDVSPSLGSKIADSAGLTGPNYHE